MCTFKVTSVSNKRSRSVFHKFPQKKHSTQAPATDILEVYLKRMA